MTTIASMPTAPALSGGRSPRTMWGLDPGQLHDCFWASRGVQVIRAGQAPIRLEKPELFMLTNARTLGIFRIDPIVRRMQWQDPALLMVRLQNTRNGLASDGNSGAETGTSSREQPLGEGGSLRSAWVAFTADCMLADRWQSTSDNDQSWRRLRRLVRRGSRSTMILRGRIYDLLDEPETAALVGDLVKYWPNPGAIVNGIRKVGPRAWAPESAGVGVASRLARAAWIGAGRSVVPHVDATKFNDGRMTGDNEAILWDDSTTPATGEHHELRTVESVESLARKAAQRRRSRLPVKRVCDILLSAIVLTAALPLVPLITLAIYLESGRPIFWRRRCQTGGAHEFSCLQFRTLRSDANTHRAAVVAVCDEESKQRQFQSETRVGAILRRYHLDELPKFMLVLRGDMTVVGPCARSSAASRHGSVGCVAWHPPGVTGPWRIRRLRGLKVDSAQAIQMDLEYHIHAGWRLDLSILGQTIQMFLSGADS
jgi:lipopolysaccharide/colanic/teichoic acid biosynthesis glycosyltransferase